MGLQTHPFAAAFLLSSLCLTALVTGQRLFFSGNESDSVIRVNPGQNVVIECQADGIPSPVIYWLYNGARIVQAGSAELETIEDKYYENLFNSNEVPLLKLGSTRSKLFVDCVSDKSVGEYICVAETPENRIKKTFTVRLQQQQQQLHDKEMAPIHPTGCLKRLASVASVPARIYMWTEYRLEFEGATIQLFCRATGNPPPTVFWMDRNNQPIHPGNSQKYRLLENGDLMIFNVRWSTDMGQYLCVAKNDNGQDIVDIFIYPTRP